MLPTSRISVIALGFCAGALQGCNQTSTDEASDASAYSARSRERAQRGESHLVLLDRSSISANAAPAAFQPTDINADRASVGCRSTLRYFEKHIGREIVLPGGEAGDEGWFVFTAVRTSWISAGPDPEDGLRNYLEAGPGLGRPDSKSRREFLLDHVSGLEPLRATGLARMEGHTVCGVVLSGNVASNPDASGLDIRGANLGKVGLEILRCERRPGAGPNELPQVKARILDAERVCGDDLSVFKNAPNVRRCTREHPDVERPSCLLESNVLTEEWNVFDTTRWIGDGDQLVSDGVFMARPESRSATADFVPARPVAIDSAGFIRFSNLVQFLSDAQNSFAESGALFMVNTDRERNFQNYLFVNVGYTLAPSLVFVEMFGSDGGVDFDQFEETSIAYSPILVFSVNLRVKRNSYEIGVRNEIVDTVRLQNPLAALGLFEVGVQQGVGGLRGRVLSTSIAQECPGDSVRIHPRKHFSFKGKPWKRRLGTRCKTRVDYIRWAKANIAKTRNPSWGMHCLSRMRE